ncbi:hypothetical protein [Leptospira paudalimensis]|uniref:Cthe-2314-like HEPN domain-containing protein n=1 Tax=Leptospira paudalimensis TaxID=2950024 RepID=A0ABT3M5B1_9LEPT|nr:hypothetical protein [Leptospira paudalimensis]MCW7503571.1 hypothetical protein [Leptospira paudalimensis]
MLEEKIKNTNLLIKNNEIGPNWKGHFPNLSFHYQINKEEQTNNLSKITNELTRDIWKLATTFYLIEYTRIQALKDKKLSSLFGSFTTLDIEYSHIVIRSLFDNLALLISATATKKGQLPDSYSDLSEFVNKKSIKFVELTNEPLYLLLKEYQTWFLSLKEIRDDIIHRNYNSMVFGNLEEDIYFWIKNRKDRNRIKETYPYYNLIRYNLHDVLSYSKYSGINFALTINLMEEISENIIEYSIKKELSYNTGLSSEGFGTALIWMNNVL